MLWTRQPSARGRSGGRGKGREGRFAFARNGGAALERLEQHHLDVIGLALVALGVFMGFVLYGDWDGGALGEGASNALDWLAGEVAYLVPVATAGAGAALIMRPFLPPPSAPGAGAALLLCGLLLAFAAQTAGLGPDRPPRTEAFEDPRFTSAHGGVLGESLYWAATTLFQRLGAHILAVLLIAGGLLLATGTPISTLLRGALRGARRAGSGTREMARTVRDSGLGIEGLREPDDEDIQITRANPTEALPSSALNGPLDAEPDGEETERDEADWEEAPEEKDFVYDRSELDAAPKGVPPGEAAAEPPPEQAAADAGEHSRTPMGERRGITISEGRDYELPGAGSLERGKGDGGPDPRDREQTARALLEALEHFGVQARLVGTVSGPHVSRFELQLAPGTKVAKVAQLSDDLAYALASTDIRILAPIPGKKAVGVEVPNSRRRLVRLGDVYEGRPKGSSPLLAWLGRDVAGTSVHADLALMPHALVAGTTGSGKSGCINAILSSVLMHASPNEVRMVLVDPKRVELNHYETLPHLLTPVVTNPRLAANVLGNLIGEMEQRYAVMGEARARNLVELNRVRRRAGEAPLPHILCVIDELADLMMVAPAEVEDAIIRLAQKSRAVGIHLVLATQRPSTDVITGTIKVNIPVRIAFSVASQVDSRVILDQGGAESLLGQGDMLYRPIGTSKLQRIQGAFVAEEEVARVVGHWSRQGSPDFNQELLAAGEQDELAEGDLHSPDADALLEDAARVVVEGGTASVSMLQRRLRVGYTRAGRLIDILERKGVISGYEGSKPRQVLVGEADLPRALGSGSQPPQAAEEAPGSAEGEGDAQSTRSQADPVEGAHR